MIALDEHLAQRFAASTLGHLEREYPNSLAIVSNAPGDLARPRELHPIFYGSLDWHSCVHGWWQVMRIARRFPDLAEAGQARAMAAAAFTPAKVAGELRYFARPGTAGFERPYGWGWLLALHAELALAEDAGAANALAPLAHEIAARFAAYLPKLQYPVRHGSHANTAFALLLAHDWALVHDPALADLIAERARVWFGDDRDTRPFEPSGEDFLSPTLTEAMLMLRVLPGSEAAGWFASFLPEPPLAMLAPAIVTDRSDGRLAHLDGLNLSRAWCWRALADRTGESRFAIAAEAHLTAALPHLFDDYMGEHWLASFALLALDGQ